MTNSKVTLAILDDYQNTAHKIFSHLSSRLDITTLPPALPQQELIQKLQPYTIVSTMRERTRFPAEVINALPNLKLLLTTGMRNAAIDMDAARARGVVVVGAKGKGNRGDVEDLPTSLDSTTEHCWALILGATRNIARDHVAVTQEGKWEVSHTVGLKGKVLGLLGLGNLGARAASIGVYGFGMRVLTWSTNLTQEGADEKARACGLPAGTFKVVASKEELLREADVLSIHYVLSERSRNILTGKDLALMKPTAILVNTSRGPLVNEKDLLATLEAGKIRGAALDVFETEPLPKDSPWRTTAWGKDGRSEVLLSPHMGYVEEDVMLRWYEDTANSVEQWLNGQEVSAKIN